MSVLGKRDRPSLKRDIRILTWERGDEVVLAPGCRSLLKDRVYMTTNTNAKHNLRIDYSLLYGNYLVKGGFASQYATTQLQKMQTTRAKNMNQRNGNTYERAVEDLARQINKFTFATQTPKYMIEDSDIIIYFRNGSNSRDGTGGQVLQVIVPWNLILTEGQNLIEERWNQLLQKIKPSLDEFGIPIQACKPIINLDF